MTLFGTTLDAQQIAGLVGLLAALAFWLVVLKRERGYSAWFKQWEAGRKARRDAEQGVAHGDDPPPPSDGRRGPWG